MLCLNPERLATQVIMADLALYLGSELKLEQEEGLTGVLVINKNTKFDKRRSFIEKLKICA